MQGSDKKTLRTRVYIDGYNLYYGCLKRTPYKWLDPLKLFASQILPSILHEPEGQRTTTELLPLGVKFFTAQIVPAAAKAEDSVSSQSKYHTALRKLHPDSIEIIEGYYSTQQVTVKAVATNAPKTEPRRCSDVLVWKLEEKQSDVNLSLHAYHDAISREVDQVVIVTNDTDIASCLKMIRQHTDVVVGLVTPSKARDRTPNADLSKHAHWVRTHITTTELANSQLPLVINVGRTPSTKPDSWYGTNPELFAEILKAAIKMRGSRSKAFQWLKKANSHLGNLAPIDMIDSETGAQEVLRHITAWADENK